MTYIYTYSTSHANVQIVSTPILDNQSKYCTIDYKQEEMLISLIAMGKNYWSSKKGGGGGVTEVKVNCLPSPSQLQGAVGGHSPSHYKQEVVSLEVSFSGCG